MCTSAFVLRFAERLTLSVAICFDIFLNAHENNQKLQWKDKKAILQLRNIFLEGRQTATVQ